MRLESTQHQENQPQNDFLLGFAGAIERVHAHRGLYLAGLRIVSVAAFIETAIYSADILKAMILPVVAGSFALGGIYLAFGLYEVFVGGSVARQWMLRASATVCLAAAVLTLPFLLLYLLYGSGHDAGNFQTTALVGVSYGGYLSWKQARMRR